VKIKYIDDGATRASMIKSGEADLGVLFSNNYAELDPLIMMTHVQGDPDPTLVNPDGVLKRYENILSTSSTDGFFNYSINPASTMIGSGALDGNGIPVDFFTDLHVRKAFNYAFDWDEFIDQAYGGKALPHRGPIIAGLPGYSDTQPVYSHDADQAKAEFGLASGDVANTGFTFTVAYATGNPVRQKFYEVLKANIEALNPKFHINVTALNSTDYQDAYRASSLPIYANGWMQDMPDPYNWVFPYMARGGTFSTAQHMPDSLLNLFTPKVTACTQKVGTEAAACYAELQNMAYENAIDIFLAQARSQNYVRVEVNGYYLNPAFGYSPYFYALSKGTPPETQPVTPDAPATVTFTEPTGSSNTVAIPSGSFSENVNVVVSPGAIAAGQTTGFRLGDQGFDISAFTADGSQLHPTLDAAHPVMITIHYTPDSLGGLLDDTLKLYYLNLTSGAWEDAACGAIQQDTANQTITVPVCHFTRFALGGTGYQVYLPLTKR
jgi:peptide/nickel transport system substrate-binding protein